MDTTSFVFLCVAVALILLPLLLINNHFLVDVTAEVYFFIFLRTMNTCR